MPLISVIIPVYNGEKTIEETIRSVLNQTFADFEIIVINDGSTDSTVKIVSGFTDSRIRLLSYHNGSAAASRNRGLDHVRGEYIAFLDADDLWTTGKLEGQLKALQEYPEAGLAYSWTDIIDENNQFVSRGSRISITGDAWPYLLLSNILDSGSNPLIRRQVLSKVEKFDESLIPAEDWDFYLRISENYPFVCTEKQQILYRLSPHSISSNFIEMEVSTVRLLESAFARCPAQLKYLKNQSFSNVYKYLTYKALTGKPNRKRSLIATRFWQNALRYDPQLLKGKIFIKVWLKILLTLILPRTISDQLNQNPQLDIITLMGYVISRPPE